MNVSKSLANLSLNDDNLDLADIKAPSKIKIKEKPRNVNNTYVKYNKK